MPQKPFRRCFGGGFFKTGSYAESSAIRIKEAIEALAAAAAVLSGEIFKCPDEPRICRNCQTLMLLDKHLEIPMLGCNKEFY